MDASCVLPSVASLTGRSVHSHMAKGHFLLELLMDLAVARLLF